MNINSSTVIFDILGFEEDSFHEYLLENDFAQHTLKMFGSIRMFERRGWVNDPITYNLYIRYLIKADNEFITLLKLKYPNCAERTVL